MSDKSDDQLAKTGTYKPGNVDKNGDYIVGKDRPPKEGQFKKDDGRPRGRRAKNVKNRATEFAEILETKITIVEGGKKKKVTKRKAIDLQTVDGAMKRHPSSQRIYYDQLEKLMPPQVERPALSAAHLAIIEDIRRRLDTGFEQLMPEPAASVSNEESSDDDA